MNLQPHPESPLSILLPYQRAWVGDESRFKIGLWSRQVGKSFACAAEAVRDCLLRPGAMWVVLSAGERQALEFMEKARLWARAFSFAMRAGAGIHPQPRLNLAEIRWANGSRILALPANPDTARGYSANLILDEFAFHEDPDRIWRSIYPSISNPLKGSLRLRIVSTPNGIQNKFHELWTQATLPDSTSAYSAHIVTVHDAICAGLPLDEKTIRHGLRDPDGWAQEYECRFIDGASVLLPYDLIASCESEEAGTPDLGHGETNRDNGWSSTHLYYTGIDVGRKQDLTCLWTLEAVGDLLWTRHVQSFTNIPFAEQIERLRPWVARSTRTAIDATGIGAMLAEELRRQYPSREIEPLHFHATLKEEMFLRMRRRFEERTLRIPTNDTLRHDLHSLRKTTTAHGTLRIEAPRNAAGHGDHATALALAIHAASLRGAATGSFATFRNHSPIRHTLSQRMERSLTL